MLRVRGWLAPRIETDIRPANGYATRHATVIPRRRVRTISLEQLLWFGLVLFTAVTRFWDLGKRALHHDEGLHTWYSWIFSTGAQPYVHDPLMHGPFLFHANALIFLLFGATDATTRWLPALSGVLIVAACWWLRPSQLLGRWGALAAGLMFAISPSYLYYTRFIRHDPYTALGALVLCTAIFRFLAEPRRFWMILAFVCVALMLANHEISFAILAAFVLLLWGALVVARLQFLVPVHLATAALGIVVLIAHRVLHWRSLPAIPWNTATDAQTAHFYGQVITNPFVVCLIGLLVFFIAGCAWSIRNHLARRRQEPGDALAHLFGPTLPGSIAHGALAACRDWRGAVIGLAVGAFIVCALFTTMFTNLHGLATMTFAPNGTLLYWLGQQNVQRGEQPWFYFLTEIVQYEWLALFLALPATILVAVRVLRVLPAQLRPAQRETTRRPVSPRLLFQYFTAGWFVFITLVLSWAGEKMPWLLMHITLPMFLLGASFLDQIVNGAIAWYQRRRMVHGTAPLAGFTAYLVLLAGAWYLLASHLMTPIWTELPSGTWQREISPWAADHWWLLIVPPLAAIAGGIIAILAMGSRQVAYATIAAALLVCVLIQFHVSYRLAFVQPDTAIDTLIYNTTSPDVTQVSSDIHKLSNEIYGDLSMPVGVTTCNSFNVPTDWYFRDMPNKTYVNSATGDTASLPPVFIGSVDVSGCNFPADVPGYTSQLYVFRWHENEYTNYRNFALAPDVPPGYSALTSEAQPHGLLDIVKSIWSSFETLGTQSGEQRLYQLFMYREMPGGTMNTTFRLYVRNDILPQYNAIHYGE